MKVRIIMGRCYVCKRKLTGEEIEAGSIHFLTLTTEEQDEAIERLNLVHCNPTPAEEDDTGEVIVCKKCLVG